MNKYLITWLLCLFCGISVFAQKAEPGSYLNEIKAELEKTWPDNRTVNLVFHGHSVPSGYAATPRVNTLGAYPFFTFKNVKEKYPNAVVNVITTSIGGEQSEQGAKRFKKDVLCHRPDVLFIDYALNDRGIGLARAREAWEDMIESALQEKIKVILFTPTPDLNEDILDKNAPLAQHARQIRELAEKYHVGLTDSYEAFRQLALQGKNLKEYMSQSNHPNEKGHRVVAGLIAPWFEKQNDTK
jgi:lysophospholipase L1-like esterase